VSLTQAIKDEARRLGFSLAGFTTPEPAQHWPAFERWLKSGRHGSMDYLTDQRRADPRLVLPECSSILVLAMNYPNPSSVAEKQGGNPSGRVAAYAWGRDYHLLISERLESLATCIVQLLGFQVPMRWYTDTGPILERDLAQCAGLGWIGRNTCLIHPKMGSYFQLAEILLGIEMEADAPFHHDRCGTCNRCLKACPTGCILPDRTLDARRCIAYLTIENKNGIPLDLRPPMGNRIFGCDICQQVCPWNRFATQEFDPAFKPDPGFPNLDLMSDISLSPEDFNRKFKDSPVLRSKRRGYLRNVAVGLGNSGDPSAIPVLEKASLEDEPLVREHAKWALEQITKNIHPGK
jgi:epoxyqueuosine reductase